MLDEHEWGQVLPALTEGMRQIQGYRARHDVSLLEAKQHIYGTGALDRYFELTGYRETDVQALWHHRLSRFGPPCSTCGKPLRTSRAKLCAECGAPAAVN